MKAVAAWFALMLYPAGAGEPVLPARGLAIDLDAAKGLLLEDGERVARWTSQTAGGHTFVKRDEGRAVAGSGRPTLRKAVPEIGGKPALVFRQQELVCLDEDAFDGLSTGKGLTWIALLAVHEQRVGLADVNSFFGNLRNRGGKFEGVWGCLNDDNTPWWGARNGVSFGRFDANNPKLSGPRLELGRFHLLAGRMAAGTGTVKLEFFVDTVRPVAVGEVAVNPAADPSRMAVGQERDAIEHPGHESFDGELARFLVWERPLDDPELAAAVELLRAAYFGGR
jgi:hypothetical protein